MSEYIWSACPECGKERQVKKLSDSEAFASVVAASLCRACEMDFAQRENHCPELVRFDNEDGRGAGMCRLSWHHEGRCEGFVIPREIIEAHRAARKGNQP